MIRIRPALLVAAVAAAMVLTATPALAHTEAGSSTGADGATTVTLDVEHGCDAKPTIGLRVQLPAGASEVDAEDPDGWTNTVTATEIDWKGPALPADAHHEFSFAVHLTQSAGTTVAFPTIQQCTDGAELAWIELSAAGQPEPPHPAPTVVVGGTGAATLTAVDQTTTTIATSNTTARMAPDSNAVTKDGSATNSTGRIVFLVVVAVIVIGALAVFLSARRRKQRGA